MSLYLLEHQFLLLRSEFPPQEPTDWAQPVKLDCRCADCRQLQSFAEDPAQKVILRPGLISRSGLVSSDCVSVA